MEVFLLQSPETMGRDQLRFEDRSLAGGFIVIIIYGGERLVGPLGEEVTG